MDDCMACEGNPKPPNVPCAVCGRSPNPRVSAAMVEAGKNDLAMVRRFVETMKGDGVANTAVPLGAIERVFALIATLAVTGE